MTSQDVSQSAINTTEMPVDQDELQRQKIRRLEKIGRWALPMAIMIFAIIAWDRICVWNEIPKYILPRPGVVLDTVIKDAAMLFGALLVTLRITFLSLILAVVGGVVCRFYSLNPNGSRCHSSRSQWSCR